MILSERTKRVLALVTAAVLAVAAVGVGWEVALRARPLPKLNAWGYHDAQPDLDGGARRILLLGDSFVEGIAVPVQDVVGQRLQQHLAGSGPAVVVSLGQPGAGQAAELALLEKYLPLVRPELVLLAFLPANDVLNNSSQLDPKKEKPFFRLTETGLEFVPSTPQPKPLRSRWRVIDEVRRLQDVRRQSQAKIDAGNGVPLDFRVYQQPASPEWASAWRLTEALLARVDQTVRDVGAKLVVVVIAERFQVDKRAWGEAEQEYPPLREGRWDPTAPARRVLDWCAGRQISAIDLYDAFASGDPDALYLPDGHWSRVGHDTAAREIARQLAARDAGVGQQGN